MSHLAGFDTIDGVKINGMMAEYSQLWHDQATCYGGGGYWVYRACSRPRAREKGGVRLLVRTEAKIPENIAKYLEGSNLMAVDVLNRDAVERAVFEYEPTSVICCLASRDGLGKNAWKVDYGGGVIC